MGRIIKMKIQFWKISNKIWLNCSLYKKLVLRPNYLQCHKGSTHTLISPNMSFALFIHSRAPLKTYGYKSGSIFINVQSNRRWLNFHKNRQNRLFSRLLAISKKIFRCPVGGVNGRIFIFFFYFLTLYTPTQLFQP